jgi:hypothetical protein
MKADETIACYCMNRTCDASIYHGPSALCVQVPLNWALSSAVKCGLCNQELQNKLELEMKDEIYKILLQDM